MGFCAVIVDILVSIAFHEVTSLHPLHFKDFPLVHRQLDLCIYGEISNPVHCIVVFLYIKLQVYSLGKRNALKAQFYSMSWSLFTVCSTKAEARATPTYRHCGC